MRTLYIVATPIGNLEDFTYRAVRILKEEVSHAFAEDTRVTITLLKRYNITVPLHALPEGGSPLQRKRAQELLDRSEDGVALAYMSDAGTPGISDPGNWLVQQALACGWVVVPLPGASAPSTLLSISANLLQHPLFVGYLPKKKGRQTMHRKLDQALRDEVCDAVVMFESPERIVKLLEEISLWQQQVHCVLGRELTKKFEEVIRGPLPEVLEQVRGRVKVKGEVTLLVTPIDS